MGPSTCLEVDHMCKYFTMEEIVSNKHQEPNDEVHKRGGKPLFITKREKQTLTYAQIISRPISHKEFFLQR